MLQVKTAGAGPSMFAGAHHQSFENGDFRIAGRDMYHVPTVNVNITTPTSPGIQHRSRIALDRAPASQVPPSSPRPQGERGLWRVARFLRSRSGRGNPSRGEELRSTAADVPHTSSNPTAVQTSLPADDFAFVRYEETKVLSTSILTPLS